MITCFFVFSLISNGLCVCTHACPCMVPKEYKSNSPCRQVPAPLRGLGLSRHPPYTAKYDYIRMRASSPASVPIFVRAWRIANAQKNREHFCSRLGCGRWDLNPHGVPTTRSLVLLVCQFRHFRAILIKLSRMQEMGLEPTLCCHNRHLKPARLPFRHSCEQMLFY